MGGRQWGARLGRGYGEAGMAGGVRSVPYRVIHLRWITERNGRIDRSSLTVDRPRRGTDRCPSLRRQSVPIGRVLLLAHSFEVPPVRRPLRSPGTDRGGWSKGHWAAVYSGPGTEYWTERYRITARHPELRLLLGTGYGNVSH